VGSRTTPILIASGQAAEYLRLLSAAELPGAVLLTEDAALDEVEIVLGNPERIRRLLDRLPKLRWAQTTWAGVEPLLDPGLRRDYLLTNARGVFGKLMSEYVFAYLLLHERKILQRLEAQRQARWDATLTGTLRGKSIGLLGVGSIGGEIARTARFFGMRVRGCTRSQQTCPDVDAWYSPDSLPAFATGLDYLVCVLPNTSATRGMVDAGLLAQLPPHALLINIGRGAAVDEGALLAALERGALGGAVLDVFTQEPLPPEHPLWRAPNVFITSHSAGPSFPAEIAGLFRENYRRFQAGEPLRYRVDFEREY
jgi:phosphoglycerate dehydrogenase-like enzyme